MLKVMIQKFTSDSISQANCCKLMSVKSTKRSNAFFLLYMKVERLKYFPNYISSSVL